MIPDAYIDHVRENVSMIDLMSAYCSFQRRGADYFSLCPFPDHIDSDPSFAVNPSKRIYKCFGCGRGGNIFTFLCEIEGYSFPEAVKVCAESIGLDFDYDTAGSNIRDRIYLLLRDAAVFYHRRFLFAADSTLTYLYHTRRLTKEIAERYAIGYATGKGFFQQYFDIAKRLYSEDCLHASGIFYVRDDGTGFDLMEGRYTFPIHNLSGNIVALGGRTVKGKPKYKNTQESIAYAKSKVLYNLYQAKSAIQETRTVIIVEGYFDVLRMVQSGLRNVVGLCGTALSLSHAKVLRGLAAKAILMLDNDAGGKRAIAKSFAALYSAGFNNVYVVTDYDVKDPDELFSASVQQGIHALKRAVKFQTLLEKQYANFDALVDVVRSIAATISHNRRREVFISWWAKKLTVSTDLFYVEKQPANKYIQNDDCQSALLTTEYSLLAASILASLSEDEKCKLSMVPFSTVFIRRLCAKIVYARSNDRSEALPSMLYNNVTAEEAVIVSRILNLTETGLSFAAAYAAYRTARRYEVETRILSTVAKEESAGVVKARTLQLLDKVFKHA